MEWLEEDCPFWDVTTDYLIPEGKEIKAVILAKESGVVACLKEISEVLERMGIKVERLKEEGESFRSGDKIAYLYGEARKILKVERTLLNVLSHLFGVAKATKRLVRAVKRANPKVSVAATRKTTPGMRDLEKKAVIIGGGEPHRFSLSDMVLIKDNHLAIIGDLRRAVLVAKEKAGFTKKVEIEVTSKEEAVMAAMAGADIIMLDNMPLSEVKETLKELKKRGLRDKVLVEISGGITFENAHYYAEAGPDIISTSLITLKAPPVDISLEVVKVD